MLLWKSTVFSKLTIDETSRLPQTFLKRPIAHRGLHDKSRGIIENSPSAFREAIAHGYPIECDLQPCAGNIPVVFHDHDLKRLTGQRGQITDIAIEDLASLTLTGGDETPLSYAALLKFVSGRVPLLVEVKDQDGALGEDINHAFIKNIAEITKRYGGDIALMSFNPYVIVALRKMLSDAPLGLVTDNFLKPDWRNVPATRAKRLNRFEEIPELDFDFISHDVRDLKMPAVASFEKPILTWTVNSATKEKKAREIVDNITFEAYIPNETTTQ